MDLIQGIKRQHLSKLPYLVLLIDNRPVLDPAQRTRMEQTSYLGPVYE